MFFRFFSIQMIWSDAADRGALADGLWHTYQCHLEIAESLKSSRFQREAKGWIVERTVSWFGRYRRLNLNYQRYPSTAENFVYMAMIRWMLKRLKSISKQVLNPGHNRQLRLSSSILSIFLLIDYTERTHQPVPVTIHDGFNVALAISSLFQKRRQIL